MTHSFNLTRFSQFLELETFPYYRWIFSLIFPFSVLTGLDPMFGYFVLKKLLTIFSSDFNDANLVSVTSDCCEGPPANDFLVCFDFLLGSPAGSTLGLRSDRNQNNQENHQLLISADLGGLWSAEEINSANFNFSKKIWKNFDFTFRQPRLKEFCLQIILKLELSSILQPFFSSNHTVSILIQQI